MSDSPSGSRRRPDETIAPLRLEKLLLAKGGRKHRRLADGVVLYVMPAGGIVRMPAGFARIPEVVVREVALVQLGMDTWEYDYWLSEQDRGPNYTTPKPKKKRHPKPPRRKK